MRPILTPAESEAIDRETQARGVSASTLMERAGREVAAAAAAIAGGVYGRRAVVVCGKGNNGGDGLVAARHLAGRGMAVSVVMVESPVDLREPAATNLLRLKERGAIRTLGTGPGLLGRELGRADVAVDAVFGTGFRGIPEDEFAAAIAGLNAAGVPVVAVDIPSGVNGETGEVEGDAVAADVTVTFGALKPGLVFLPGAERAGLVEVVDIGFPADLVTSDLSELEASDVSGWLRPRRLDAHKREAGVVLVLAGSRSMTGAACLASEAAYRAGAGYVMAAVPEGILPVVQTVLREATYLPLPETADGTVAASAADVIAERLASVDSVAMGPGLTRHPETMELVGRLVRESTVPLVVDADGLNAFAGRAADLADRKSDAVLTPHAGEFGRLAGIASRSVLTDRVGHARALAGETRAVVLLKGHPTIVAAPDGSCRVNATGGPALATAGSGDVLTGTIAALLARGLSAADAAAAGAYLHGLAGDLAGRRRSEGTTAGDVLAELPAALEAIRS